VRSSLGEKNALTPKLPRVAHLFKSSSLEIRLSKSFISITQANNNKRIEIIMNAVINDISSGIF
jgi:hypothetical protein